MTFLKLLINFSIFGIFLGMTYCLFYFEVVPKLITHYRKVVRRGKMYDNEIGDIRREKDQ